MLSDVMPPAPIHDRRTYRSTPRGSSPARHSQSSLARLRLVTSVGSDHVAELADQTFLFSDAVFLLGGLLFPLFLLSVSSSLIEIGPWWWVGWVVPPPRNAGEGYCRIGSYHICRNWLIVTGYAFWHCKYPQPLRSC